MFLLVGLGNPGKEYEATRHNAGFMAVDEIIHRFSFSESQKKFHGLLSSGIIDGQKALVLKPQTYMNRSGVSVSEAVSFYKIPLENVFVFL
jgi:PTH1 family peptidyl-tRNA hydrolase